MPRATHDTLPGAARDARRGAARDTRPAPRDASIGIAPATLPGGFPAARFLARHWQRRPLLVRAAFPAFSGLFTRAQLFALALRDDVESRLVERTRGRYTLAHGPFRAADLRRLPPRNWTLLVQGVNLVDREADALLRRFAFLPYARLDDLMVSYAAPGGGVGPHFDSYDVFLLQGFGRRRWRYGAQRDLTLRPGLPVKVLQRFAPTHDSVLEPGDMLYLPPRYAHDGVAVDACTTYSIGFRAPAYQELAEAFLDYLRDRVELPGRYGDAGAQPTRHPARLDDALVARMGAPLARVRWRARVVARFLGAYLSEPKPHVVFDEPARPLSLPAFAARAARRGVRLDPRAQVLYDARELYVNGDVLAPPPGTRAALRRLADARALDGATLAAAPAFLLAVLHDWYSHGFLELDAG
jgi:50S ribosomal protein L16 3-hydroxylase